MSRGRTVVDVPCVIGVRVGIWDRTRTTPAISVAGETVGAGPCVFATGLGYRRFWGGFAWRWDLCDTIQARERGDGEREAFAHSAAQGKEHEWQGLSGKGVRGGGRGSTYAERLTRSVDLVGLLLLPVCTATRRVGTEKNVYHDLKDARWGDGGGEATACGAVSAAVLE